MTFTLQELAALSGGELVGDSTLKITGAASLSEATPGEISFFTDRKYIGLLRKTRASALFVPPGFGGADQRRADSRFQSDQGLRAGAAQIRARPNHIRAWYSSHRTGRSRRSARRACFNSAARGHRTGGKHWRRHNHWRGELRRTRDGDRVRVSHLSERDNSRAKPDWLARNYFLRRCFWWCRPLFCTW